MVTITFPDRATQKRALGLLLGPFPGRIFRSGEHIVPEAALETLVDAQIPFSVQGNATYEQRPAAPDEAYAELIVDAGALDDRRTEGS